MIDKQIVLVRGAGDLATGVIQKLWRSGFLVTALETAEPTTIRRQVALSTAVRHGRATVEDVTAVFAKNMAQVRSIWKLGNVPILIDPYAEAVKQIKPVAVVDAILAKRNLGTDRQMAPITVALGPGFRAPDDVDAVIETMRGHSLGRLITEGQALPNTGIPGEIGGESAKRVIHALAEGTIRHNKVIGDRVERGETLLWIDELSVESPLDGILRGLIEEGLQVSKGLKIADVDPRIEVQNEVFTISDKARCLGGATLEAILFMARQKGVEL